QSAPADLLATKGETPVRSQEPIRTDRNGDPLPPGSVARLGTQRMTLLGQARFLTFSPDGRRLAAHDGHENLRIWEVSSAKVVLRLKTPRFSAYGPGMSPLMFSPDGKAIALGCPEERSPQRGLAQQGNTVRLWDVATGKELHRLGGDLKGQMTQLRFS